MRAQFAGYYQPTEEEIGALWREATFVLDTNVLLNLYRYPQQARDDLFSVLEKISDRLWVPFHVALEYQRNRVTVIAGENSKFDITVRQLNTAETELEQAVERLELGKRGLGIQTEPLTSALKQAIAAIRTSVDEAKGKQLTINHRDSVRERLEHVLGDRVGPPPTEQAALDALVADGTTRYQKRIPPGFMDLGKTKKPDEATFFHDGIEYPAEFGDLIIWRQVLQYAKDSKIKRLIFVTGDRKEDWWAREQGKTLGPLPELIQEIKRVAGVELFWIYAVDQFLDHAQRYFDAKIEESSVSEVREVQSVDVLSAAQEPVLPTREYFDKMYSVMRKAAAETEARWPYNPHRDGDMAAASFAQVPAVVNRKVMDWILANSLPGEEIDARRGRFPEILLRGSSGTRGIHVVYDDYVSTAGVLLEMLMECSAAANNNKYTGITLIFVAMPFGLGLNGATKKEADDLANSLPNVRFVYLRFDDRLNLLA